MRHISHAHELGRLVDSLVLYEWAGVYNLYRTVNCLLKDKLPDSNDPRLSLNRLPSDALPDFNNASM